MGLPQTQPPPKFCHLETEETQTEKERNQDGKGLQQSAPPYLLCPVAGVLQPTQGSVTADPNMWYIVLLFSSMLKMQGLEKYYL